MSQLLRRDDLTIHLQSSGAGVSESADIVEGQSRKPQSVIFEIVFDRVLARRQRSIALPFHPLEIEEVPGELGASFGGTIGAGQTGLD